MVSGFVGQNVLASEQVEKIRVVWDVDLKNLGGCSLIGELYRGREWSRSKFMGRVRKVQS